ncbi:MAG: helix-turn-helix domain-containing protein [Clostridia bacterium]|nr:helix-turn-helix domain-containing protein [Clostridia bacterium]
MNTYITGHTVRRLREKKGMTQAELAAQLGVSDKAVSKWETAKGLPDITLIEPLAAALGVSVTELLSGQPVQNQNRSANLLRSKFYVCPLCGNILHATGDAVVHCCGISLPPLEAEDIDDDHTVTVEPIEDEYFVTVRHEMNKTHYISFMAYVTGDRLQLVKLYPEGNAETRFSLRGAGVLYLYCNRHGLMKYRPKRT